MAHRRTHHTDRRDFPGWVDGPDPRRGRERVDDDLPRSRGVPEETQTVTQSQVLASAPLVAGALPVHEWGDEISSTFFTEGTRQEGTGQFIESDLVRVKSLDRVPRRWGLILLLPFILLTMAGGLGWFAGLRPPNEWQESQLWQTLRLPKMEPPEKPLLKLW